MIVNILLKDGNRLSGLAVLPEKQEIWSLLLTMPGFGQIRGILFMPTKS